MKTTSFELVLGDTMNILWISFFVIFPIGVMIITLAMCKAASVADRKMDLLRADDYKSRPCTSRRNEPNNEFKNSSEEKTTPRLGHSGVQS